MGGMICVSRTDSYVCHLVTMAPNRHFLMFPLKTYSMSMAKVPRVFPEMLERAGAHLLALINHVLCVEGTFKGRWRLSD